MDQKEKNDKKQQLLDKALAFVRSKDLGIFLFFLLLSIAMWTLQTLSERYETVVKIPVQYEGIPVGFQKSEKLVDTLRVTVSDQGRTLAQYRLRMAAERLGFGFDPIVVARGDIKEGTTKIRSRKYESQIQKILNPSTQLLRIYPDTISISLAKIVSKVLPVRLNATLQLHQQYILSQPIEIEPAKIEVFGTEAALRKIDSISTIKADSLFLDISEDKVVVLPMLETDEISLNVKEVSVSVYAEQYTEKQLDVVAVNPVNVPQGVTLRTFPSYVSVTCKIGLSKWDRIVPSSFVATVDYAKVAEASQGKLTVSIDKIPEGAFDIKVQPSQVEYLIESNALNYSSQQPQE